MIVPSSNGTMSARMRIVEEHVTRENEGTLAISQQKKPRQADDHPSD
jgi:hypothetical protein